MQNNAAPHLGLQVAKIFFNLQGCSTCDPLKYKMGIPMLIASVCLRKSIRIQRVNETSLFFSAKLKDTAVLAEEKTTVVSNGVHSPDGLAVDWLFKHIYWTDTGHDTISVASYDGTQVRTLISSDLDDPRAISVDPEYG